MRSGVLGGVLLNDDVYAMLYCVKCLINESHLASVVMCGWVWLSVIRQIILILHAGELFIYTAFHNSVFSDDYDYISCECFLPCLCCQWMGCMFRQIIQFL
jgi:hypothetical protein